MELPNFYPPQGIGLWYIGATLDGALRTWLGSAVAKLTQPEVRVELWHDRTGVTGQANWMPKQDGWAHWQAQVSANLNRLQHVLVLVEDNDEAMAKADWLVTEARSHSLLLYLVTVPVRPLDLYDPNRDAACQEQGAHLEAVDTWLLQTQMATRRGMICVDLSDLLCVAPSHCPKLVKGRGATPLESAKVALRQRLSHAERRQGYWLMVAAPYWVTLADFSEIGAWVEQTDDPDVLVIGVYPGLMEEECVCVLGWDSS